MNYERKDIIYLEIIYLYEKNKYVKNKYDNDFYSRISAVLKSAKEKVVQAVNTTMVETYFEIGKLIIEEEQNGKERAEYGKQILKELSKQLTREFGKGFSEDNLGNMRKFYLNYHQEISETPSRKSETTKIQSRFNLSWSHYLKLMHIEDERERKFYEIESTKNNWSLRELQRQYDSALYTRLALSRNKKGVSKLSEQGQVLEKPHPENNKQIFASKYQTVLPSKEKLKEILVSKGRKYENTCIQK